MQLADAYLYLSGLKKKAAIRKALMKCSAVDFVQENHPQSLDVIASSKKSLSSCGAKFWACESDGFPKGLMGLSDWPMGLFYKGDRGLLDNKKTVAIVGTRRATPYGLAVAKAIAKELARRDIVVVSGLALGVDAAAHQGALDANGVTVGVLGCGIDRVYPRENKDLFSKVELDGLLLSEYEPGFAPTTASFPQRNRLVVGLADAVVVVESEAKGGAMITATLAQKMGKPLFAVPGRIDSAFSEGAHLLINQGACLIGSVDGFIEQLAEVWQGSQGDLFALSSTSNKKSTPVISDKRLKLFAESGALLPEEYALKSNVDFAQASALLMELELEGKVARRLDGRYEVANLL